ncbi:alpha-2 adrenergic receptor [Trichonephila clavipes]|nr:alpha-2 adrenergic receptor [Trichonephila clavipes]
MEATREMDETMEVGENQMAGDETDGGNGIAAGEDQNDMAGDEIDGEDDVGWGNLFELENESAFKSFNPNAAVLFVDVAIQPEVRFIAKQNSLVKIGSNGNFVLGPFDESTPCLMIVLMNCQTKLRINHLTAVKSVAILESNANLNFYTWKKHSLHLSDSSNELTSPRTLTTGELNLRKCYKAVFPQLKFEEARYSTFCGWPQLYGKVSELVKAGFFYLEGRRLRAMLLESTQPPETFSISNTSHLAFFAHANVFHHGGQPVPIELCITSIPEDRKYPEVICITVDHSNLITTSRNIRANMYINQRLSLKSDLSESVPLEYLFISGRGRFCHLAQGNTGLIVING